MQNVDNVTHAVLNSFDLSLPGHTLILPKNVGKDFRDQKYRNFNLTTIFNIDPSTVPQVVATEVCSGQSGISMFNLTAEGG